LVSLYHFTVPVSMGIPFTVVCTWAEVKGRPLVDIGRE
jgi:hypothetical protein